MSRRYDAMIGVGGIGAGAFFLLDGNHTLGREESRGGRFLDRRDYCKLHIISHYCKSLLGAGFAVIPAGKVGSDDPGRTLRSEMKEAGLDLRYLSDSADLPTLFSFCFVYPDGSGGNMTTSDSACSEVTPAFVHGIESDINAFAGRGIALAVPEVSVEARAELLRLGTEHGLFRAASFTSGEINDPSARALLPSVDLLAVNLDEAAAVSGISPESMQGGDIAEAAVRYLTQIRSDMLVSITGGAQGSWVWDGRAIDHLPRLSVRVESTAGAGDAHLSGMLAGIAGGLSMADSHQVARLVAAMSVTSAHTINKEIDPDSLLRFAERENIEISHPVRDFLEAHR